MVSQSLSYEHYMSVALSLGRRGLGKTWPNPSVGWVIVNDGVVVGRGILGMVAGHMPRLRHWPKPVTGLKEQLFL